MNFKIFQFRSIKTRVTLFTLAIFLMSIWLLTFFASRMLRGNIEKMIGEQQFSTVSLVASQVNIELNDRLTALRKVAKRITPAIIADAENLQVFLGQQLILQDTFNGGAFVTRTDGSVMASFPYLDQRGININDRDYIITVLKEGKSVIGKPVISKKLLFPVFVMAVPIRDSQGNIIGVMAGATDLSKPNFLDMISANSYGKAGGFILTAPQHNLIITATDKTHIMQPNPASGVNPLFDRYVQGFEGSGTAVDSRGLAVLSSAKRIPLAGWILIARTPAVEALAPIHSMQKRVLLVAILFTLLAGVLTWWMVRRQLSPMLATVEKLAVMSDTDQPLLSLGITRQDEIGDMVGGFNRLLEKLSQREKALKESEEKHRIQFDNAAKYSQLLNKTSKISKIGGWELTLETMELFWSEQVYLMHEIDLDTKITVEYAINFYTPESKPIIQNAVKAAIESGTDFNLELQITTAMNKIIWVRAQGEADYSGEKIYKLIGTFQDISEHKQAEEEKHTLEQQFQQTQKLESLGILAGGIAHDFNNILAIIMGYCSLTKMDFETAEQNIQEIEKAAERAATLCRQMLAYAGKASLTQTQVNTWILVDEMVTMLKTTTQKNVVIKPELGTDIPTIMGDASQLRQVVMNLIINAAEAIGDADGEIRVSLEKAEIKAEPSEKDHLGMIIPAGRYIFFEVTDNGSGMDEETRRKIFEPFYTTKFTGRGLGMSAVLGIIKAHNGALQLESRLGYGTTFKVYLPVQISKSETEEAHQKIVSATWQGSGTILLAEDEVQVKLIAIALIEMLGFKVLDATNGKEALELYQQNAADITLVVTDMGMPVMNGYELFYKLKQLDPQLPIVISSGFGEGEIASKFPREEIAGLINKPYNFEQLREVLRGVVDGV